MLEPECTHLNAHESLNTEHVAHPVIGIPYLFRRPGLNWLRCIARNKRARCDQVAQVLCPQCRSLHLLHWTKHRQCDQGGKIKPGRSPPSSGIPSLGGKKL